MDFATKFPPGMIRAAYVAAGVVIGIALYFNLRPSEWWSVYAVLFVPALIAYFLPVPPFGEGR